MLYYLIDLKFVPLLGRILNHFCQRFHIQILKNGRQPYGIRQSLISSSVTSADSALWILQRFDTRSKIENVHVVLPMSFFTKPIQNFSKNKSCSPASFTYLTKKSLWSVIPLRRYSRNCMWNPLAPIYGDALSALDTGYAASVILLAKIRGLVTTDGAVEGNEGELTAQATVRLGLSYGKCAACRAFQ